MKDTWPFLTNQNASSFALLEVQLDSLEKTQQSYQILIWWSREHLRGKLV